MKDKSGYTLREMMEYANITKRQVNTWTASGWIGTLPREVSFSSRPYAGSGQPRLWTLRSYRTARVMSRLVSIGIRPEYAYEYSQRFLNKHETGYHVALYHRPNGDIVISHYLEAGPKVWLEIDLEA